MHIFELLRENQIHLVSILYFKLFVCGLSHVALIVKTNKQATKTKHTLQHVLPEINAGKMFD